MKMEIFRLSFLVFVINFHDLVQSISVVPYNFSLDSNITENLELSPAHDYMNLLCNRKKILSDRNAIRMSPWTSKYPPASTSCIVGVEERAYPDYRFVITFKKMDLYGKTVGICLRSRLDLFSGQSTQAGSKISDVNGLCGSNTNHMSYETASNFLTLKYDTVNLPSGYPQYFEAVITPFHYGHCKHDEFKCSNRKCVKNNMLCDSYNNCGDDSDEKNCPGVVLTIAAIIGIVIGSVVFVAIILTIFICFCCCGCCGMCGYERF